MRWSLRTFEVKPCLGLRSAGDTHVWLMVPDGWEDQAAPGKPPTNGEARSRPNGGTSAALLHRGAYLVDLNLWFARPVRRLDVPPELRVVHHAVEAVLVLPEVHDHGTVLA
jgi:hypothetical protein